MSPNSVLHFLVIYDIRAAKADLVRSAPTTRPHSTPTTGPRRNIVRIPTRGALAGLRFGRDDRTDPFELLRAVRATHRPDRRS